MSAAVTSMRIRRYIRLFREAGALRPARAVSLEELGVRRTRVFRRMAAYGVFVEKPDGRFWMNELAADRYRRERKLRALLFLAFVLLIFGIYLAFHSL